MGRKKKYTRGTEVIALSVDKDIVEFLREQAANHRMSFSAYITEILKIFSKNSLEFAKAKAKSLFSDAYYWKSRIEMLEAGGSDHEKKSDTDTS